MFATLHAFGMFVADLSKSRCQLEAESLFLRHQLNIFLRRAPPRLRLHAIDRALLIWMPRLLRSLIGAVQVVQPDPVLLSSDVPVLAIVSSEDLHTRSIGRHDWQQQKGFTFWTGVQRRMAAKNICRPIITIIVQPWSGAA
jgi:hypothetical protein